MAPFCIFMSIRRHPWILPRQARFSSDQAALYTVPVQLPGHFSGQRGLRYGVAVAMLPIRSCALAARTIKITTE
ncbi:hypothetical protein DCO48_01200 [Pseudomonas sp. SDI]|nr:hypothetical protein DCO48_01200 [Pseudomonas sp. SDI]